VGFSVRIGVFLMLVVLFFCFSGGSLFLGFFFPFCFFFFFFFFSSFPPYEGDSQKGFSQLGRILISEIFFKLMNRMVC